MEQQQQQQQQQSVDPDDPQRKVYYFNVRGRCEHIRYLLAVAGFPYEDIRVTSDEWKELKPKTPYGTLPVFEAFGKMYGSSIAIGRMVARHGGLYGSNVKESAIIDSIVDAATDLREAALGTYSGSDEEKAEKKKVFMEKTLPNTLDILNKFLGDDKTFFVGDKVSWADIHVYTVMEILIVSAKNEGALSNHPKLQKLYNVVENIPQIKEWQNKRPVTDF